MKTFRELRERLRVLLGIRKKQLITQNNSYFPALKTKAIPDGQSVHKYRSFTLIYGRNGECVERVYNIICIYGGVSSKTYKATKMWKDVTCERCNDKQIFLTKDLMNETQH